MAYYSKSDSKRYPQIITKIITGEGIATKLGFPTINLDYKSLALDIQEGIYACLVQIGKKQYKGALHFGSKKTLNPSKKSLEVHLLDFNGKIKPLQAVSVKLVKYLRQIKKFQTIKDLQNAIKIDISQAQKWLQESEKLAISARNWRETTSKAKGTVF